MRLIATIAITIFLMTSIACVKQSENVSERLNRLNNTYWSVDPESETTNIGEKALYDCDNPMKLTISENAKQMTVRVNSNAVKANILNSGFLVSGPFTVLIQYENEKRLDPTGEPLQWMIVMPDETSFYWKVKPQDSDMAYGKSLLRQKCPAL